MPLSENDIVQALRTVQDPDVFKDLVMLNQVKGIKIVEGTVAVDVGTPSPHKDRLRQAITAAVMQVSGVEEVFVNFAAPSPPAAAGGGARQGAPSARPAHAPAGHGHAPAPRGIPGIKHMVAVGAGKGGVGKSTLALNLAVGLAMAGKKVAVLDGDIYGPSMPTLTGIGAQPPQIVGERIIPFRVSSPHDSAVSLAVMSIGFMIEKEKAIIWRGPMIHGAIQQFLQEVDWTHGAGEGGLDYLVIDLPPGTGDVAITLAQLVPLTGAVIVATPQEVALADARRAVRMYQQLGIEVLGVVENMAYFVCEHGSSYDIFGRGGAQVMAQQMGLPFLGEVPIDMRLRVHSDAGKPFANFAGDCPSRGPLLAVSDMLDKQVAIRMATRPTAKPLSVQIT